ncbi:hypothetical protein EC973_006504 [Apophysomyces ossiformis]|uniref:Rad60/SUMO-like domain-containing protein n=1 Tax=Apophysomyces ossiformis TaxID=679940 RepID=A0A8H7BR30_9FUNG|nr:hypothetical protein EC973_006504 [Apophysomyces ossiformis]
MKSPEEPKKFSPAPTPKPALLIEDLDPELAMLAEAGSTTPAGDTNDETSFEPESTTHATSTPNKITVKVQYVCRNVPDDPNVQKIVDVLKRPLKVIIRDNDRFDLLLTSYCKRKYMKKDDMVLVYQNVRVVLRATPLSLGMSPNITNHMEVYKREDYQMKLLEEETKKKEMMKQNSTEFDEELLGEAELATPEEKQEDQQEDSNRIFLKLRGKDNVDVTLRTIMKEYGRIRGLEPEMAAKVRLSFEGETLSPDITVQDTDLEDQDLISVLL